MSALPGRPMGLSGSNGTTEVCCNRRTEVPGFSRDQTRPSACIGTVVPLRLMAGSGAGHDA